MTPGLEEERVFFELLKTVDGAVRVAQIAHMGQRRGDLNFLNTGPDSGVYLCHALQHGVGTAVFMGLIFFGWNAQPGFAVFEGDDIGLAGTRG